MVTEIPFKMFFYFTMLPFFLVPVLFTFYIYGVLKFECKKNSDAKRLNNKHEYSTANETLKLLKSCNKSLKMNCWESFYVQIYRQCNRLITEQLTGDYNPPYKQAYFPRYLQHIPWQYRPHRYPHTYTHTQTEWIDIQPHTDTIYNKCKSTFQFSNLAK
jgi:hypothetical protein